jgi:hypothetical protein
MWQEEVMVSVAFLDPNAEESSFKPSPVVQPFAKHCADVVQRFTNRTACSSFVLSHGIFLKAKKADRIV